MTSDNKTNGYEREEKPSHQMGADERYDESKGTGDVLNDVFAEAHPNPGRVGCPSPNVLRELALRRRPIEDPAYLHLSECSPCWVDFRAAQKTTATAVPPHPSAVKRAVAAAAVFLLVAIGGWFFFSARSDRPKPGNTASPSQEAPANAVAMTFDLRPYAIQRGDQNQAAPLPVLLPRDRVRATILLPVGSEPGTYDLQVLDPNRQVLASSRGTAVIRDFVTTLEADLDLHTLTTGAYRLGVRHQDEDWRLFDAQLK
jgi:hypothetical protein